jgi:hypothetical protein
VTFFRVAEGEGERRAALLHFAEGEVLSSLFAFSEVLSSLFFASGERRRSNSMIAPKALEKRS